MTSSSGCQRQSPVLARENFDVKGSVRSIDTKSSGNSWEAACQMEANGGVGEGNSFAPPWLLASIGAIRVFRRSLLQLIL
jgi:hypothetical protein